MRAPVQSCPTHRFRVGSKGDGKTANPRRIRSLLRAHQWKRGKRRIARTRGSPARANHFGLQFDCLRPDCSAATRVFHSTGNDFHSQQAVGPTCSSGTWDLQHEFFSNTVATVSYVGSKGTHLTRFIDINQLPPLALFRRTLISCMRPSDRTIAVQSIQTPMRFPRIRTVFPRTRLRLARVGRKRGAGGSKPSRLPWYCRVRTNPDLFRSRFPGVAL